jgi:hypothetical protein
MRFREFRLRELLFANRVHDTGDHWNPCGSENHVELVSIFRVKASGTISEAIIESSLERADCSNSKRWPLDSS